MDNIKIGLAGNPNVGKTTLFNQLTGLHQHVGNWPGKTVERIEGHLNYNDLRLEIIDLPGNYSLSAHSIEEIISRDFIIDESSDVIVNVIDATNLERNLYLTIQMMELGANLVIALNMNKYAKKEGYNININHLSRLLGVPVIEIEARDNSCKDKLLKAIEDAAINPIDSSKKLVYGTKLSEHLGKLKKLVECNDKLLDVPPSWTAIKLLESDDIVTEKVKNAKNFIEIFNKVEKLKKHFRNDFGESSEELIANYRYSFIDGLIKESVIKSDIEKTTITEKIDKIATNRILSLPIFFIIIWTIFQITFAIGGHFQNLLEKGFTMLGQWVLAILGENSLSSLIAEGIIGGVGGVLTFLPIILLMFFLISFLEGSGYFARAAFLMDKFMHKVSGLHGKAFIPMILGFGCGVPAIMGTRIMENEKDRILTMIIIPFMSCTARLPVYALFVAAFFKNYQSEVILSLYILGIAVAIVLSVILKHTTFKGENSPFIMELPSYKLPSLKSILTHTWIRSYGFIRKAGTIVLLASVIIWILSSLPMGVEYGTQESVIGQIGTVIAPIFQPLGFSEWESSVALISGIVAKEVVVGTFSTLFGVDEEGGGISSALNDFFTPLSAYSFLVFVLLYVPCFATVVTIKKETNSWKWALFMVFVSIATAYTVSFIVYRFGTLLGLG